MQLSISANSFINHFYSVAIFTSTRRLFPRSQQSQRYRDIFISAYSTPATVPIPPNSNSRPSRDPRTPRTPRAPRIPREPRESRAPRTPRTPRPPRDPYPLGNSNGTGTMRPQEQDQVTFNLPDTDPPIPVHLPSHINLSKDRLLAFPPFHSWLTTLTHSLSLQQSYPSHPFHSCPYTLRSITIQAVDFFGGQRIGFIKLVSNITNSQGESLPGSTFLRGGSVAILVILEPDDKPSHEIPDSDRYILLTVQPRIPAGSLAFTEIPAGMIDDNTGNIKGAAITELSEECGISIPSTTEGEGSLIDLTRLTLEAGHASTGAAQTRDDEEKLEDGVYMSPGGCDEFMRLYAYVHRVKREEIKSWRGRLGGKREEGEKITLKVVGFEEVWKGTRDGKALAAWCLYKELRAAGKVGG